jgi:hypothetical protein
MPPKHPYIDDASKGALLALINNGDTLFLATKKAKINPKTARGIKRRADEITVYCDTNDLLLPSLYDQVTIAPKLGRPQVLSEIQGNQLKEACKQDRQHHEMFQFEVAEELNIKASRTMIRRETKTQRLNR